MISTLLFLSTHVALILPLSALLTPIYLTTASSLNPTLHRRILFPQGKIWDATVPFLTRACKLGIYTGPNSGVMIAGKFLPTSQKYDSWEGFPLGSNYDPETNQVTLISEKQRSSVCHNIADEIGGKLEKNGVQQIYMAGYCYCLFYHDKSCQDAVEPNMLVRNKVSTSLGDDWKEKIKSFSCKKYSTWIFFTSCNLWFSPGGNDTFHFEYTQSNIDEWTGKGPCESISPAVFRHWIINGCTCSFYTDLDCKSRILLDGHSGWVQRENMTILGKQEIKSFRCDLPYAPAMVVPNSYFEKGY
ncbi:hypothetical protein TWF192_010467 [Orbilia oligospora]|uniref:Uncharacterized protein n=1 Tax=Orbilia oligospora TaxID=2813651 RepID=A0A6G1MIF8_ORBOL|nr:hypothetical protein TWF191_006530 [Orbilia oligospora]KAF3259610.1 hypothetical protein TWF192_010467 [Orbilia oligospora]